MNYATLDPRLDLRAASVSYMYSNLYVDKTIYKYSSKELETLPFIHVRSRN
jgi:hypothetical protein